jgi:hypothetical protein
MASHLAMAPHLAMTNTITGTDERRFATEGSTERLAGFAHPSTVCVCVCACVCVCVCVCVRVFACTFGGRTYVMDALTSQTHLRQL